MRKKIIIVYDNHTFTGYLELAYHLLNNNIDFEKHIFPSNRMYLLRILLEDRFNKKFPWKAIKEIIEDKSWQWRTREHVEQYVEERYKDVQPTKFSRASIGSHLPWKSLEYRDGKWLYRREDLV